MGRQLLILKIWRHKIPALAALGTIALVFLWPSIPLKGVTNWLRFFYYYSPQNYLYSVMAILSGLYVGIYAYDKWVAKCCDVKSAKLGASGSIFGVLLGACPACIPVLAIFLPLSVTIYLSYISWIFIVIAIIFLAFFIHRMNGFKRL